MRCCYYFHITNKPKIQSPLTNCKTKSIQSSKAPFTFSLLIIILRSWFPISKLQVSPRFTSSSLKLQFQFIIFLSFFTFHQCNSFSFWCKSLLLQFNSSSSFSRYPLFHNKWVIHFQVQNWILLTDLWYLVQNCIWGLFDLGFIWVKERKRCRGNHSVWMWSPQ